MTGRLRFGITEAIAAGVAVALFVVLTQIQVPVGIPNTCLELRVVVTACVSAAYGPLAGAITGVIGHIIADAAFDSRIWWSWVIPEIVAAVPVGWQAGYFSVREGGFWTRQAARYNVTQVLSNAAAWILLAPLLDMLFYGEEPRRVFLQGTFAFLGNFLSAGILGTALLMGYSFLIRRKSSGNGKS